MFKREGEGVPSTLTGVSPHVKQRLTGSLFLVCCYAYSISTITIAVCPSGCDIYELAVSGAMTVACPVDSGRQTENTAAPVSFFVIHLHCCLPSLSNKLQKSQVQLKVGC